MNVKQALEYNTTLPDGAVEDECDFVVWPGRPAAEAIRGLLAELGCETDEVEAVGEKGWELNFRYQGRRLWTRTTQIELHFTCFDDRNLWPRIVGGTHPLYREFLERFAAAFASDSRFLDPRWSTLKDFAPTISPEEATA